MRVLVVKTSSMGDIIHTLPALTDAANAIPNIQFDWVAEESFVEIPSWHRAVDRVIPIALRRWRKNLFSRSTVKEFSTAMKKLQERRYDFIIDAQGLIKSAALTRFAHGFRCGMDRGSCKEPLAALAYHVNHPITKGVHAIDRVRQLFAIVLGYDNLECTLEYGIDFLFENQALDKPYVIFLHGTSGPTKHWPQSYCITLSGFIGRPGLNINLPWGNREEYERAMEIAKASDNTVVLPRISLAGMAGALIHASAVVGVDTGLAHLSAALGIPGVTLYLATMPELTGTCGVNQVCLAFSKFTQTGKNSVLQQESNLNLVECNELSAEIVWRYLENKIVA